MGFIKKTTKALPYWVTAPKTDESHRVRKNKIEDVTPLPEAEWTDEMRDWLEEQEAFSEPDAAELTGETLAYTGPIEPRSYAPWLVVGGCGLGLFWLFRGR
jgi:hypothetical protein